MTLNHRFMRRKMKELIDGLKTLLEKYEKLSYYLNDPNDDFDSGKSFAYRSAYSDIEKLIENTKGKCDWKK